MARPIPVKRMSLSDTLRRPVPPSLRNELGLLWVTGALFAVQVVTGILLTLYYQPTPDSVRESIAFLMRDVSWGWLMRGLHHWAAQAMILVVAVRLVYLYWTARYAHSHWAWYGCVLSFWIVSVQTFSGDLLPWDESAYGQVTQLLAGLEAVPWIGDFLAVILRGGARVSATTLTRTYSAHAMFLPWVIWLLLLGDLWLSARRAAWLTGDMR